MRDVHVCPDIGLVEVITAVSPTLRRGRPKDVFKRQNAGRGEFTNPKPGFLLDICRQEILVIWRHDCGGVLPEALTSKRDATSPGQEVGLPCQKRVGSSNMADVGPASTAGCVFNPKSLLSVAHLRKTDSPLQNWLFSYPRKRARFHGTKVTASASTAGAPRQLLLAQT